MMILKLLPLYFMFLYNPISVEYDIVEVYKGFSPDDGTIVLTKFNNVEDAELILVPIKIEPGNYNVKVTRKAKDLYSVDKLNVFIKTRYCSEYSVNADVSLKISIFSGDSRGKIIFSE
jgi:hypothetical protein